MQDSAIGAYSRINNLVKGFDKKIMQAAFKVHRLTMCKSTYFVFIEKFIYVVIEVVFAQ